jgi:hypothetical protein
MLESRTLRVLVLDNKWHYVSAFKWLKLANINVEATYEASPGLASGQDLGLERALALAKAASLRNCDAVFLANRSGSAMKIALKLSEEMIPRTLITLDANNCVPLPANQLEFYYEAGFGIFTNRYLLRDTWTCNIMMFLLHLPVSNQPALAASRP